MLHQKPYQKTDGIYDKMVLEQLIFNFSEKKDVGMIQLLLLYIMLQLGYYAIQMQGCFKMAFVDAHASCFGKHKHRLISVPLWIHTNRY